MDMVLFSNEGMEACLWSEMVRTEEHFFSQLFPRMFALAERSWHKAPWEVEQNIRKRSQLQQDDWEQFAHIVGLSELKFLEDLGIPYRLPVPGVR